MIPDFTDSMFYLKYLEENSHLITKLSIPVFESFKIITDSSDTLNTLRQLHNLENDSRIVAEDIGPVLLNLKELQKNLVKYIHYMTSLKSVYDIIKTISKQSQDLLAEQQFLSDISVGFFGSSDTVSEHQFDKSFFYFLDESSIDVLIFNLYQFVKLFETDGTSGTIKNHIIQDLTDEIKKLIDITLFISNKFLPNIVFGKPPSIFSECSKLGKKIYSLLDIFRSTYSVIKTYEILDEAIAGFEELAEKYKSNPTKKIKLDGFFFQKDGAKELQEILEKTEKLVD